MAGNTESDAVGDIGEAIKQSCTDAFEKLKTNAPPEDCDCELLDSIADVAGSVVELSGDAVNAAASAGGGMKDAAESFNSFASQNIGNF